MSQTSQKLITSDEKHWKKEETIKKPMNSAIRRYDFGRCRLSVACPRHLSLAT